MNKLGIFALLAAKIAQVRKRTWLLIGLGLMFLFGLTIWAAIALMSWFFGQVRDWSAAAPGAARDTLATVERQVEQVAPAASATVSEIIAILKPEDRPRRDVSGTDFAPVTRYPGLTRSHWHREGRQVSVHYEGKADYAAVLQHYVQGFGAQGYAQEVRSATPEAETHTWSKGKQRYVATISRLSTDAVVVQIETTLE